MSTAPAAPDPEAVERGRYLFAQDCGFIAAAAAVAALPLPAQPEIAFAGRSNVGKSSLVNALTGRRMLARTSHTPGRTRQVIFFALGGRLVLVDLPGYGYARASKGDVAHWTGLVEAYLTGRPNLDAPGHRASPGAPPRRPSPPDRDQRPHRRGARRAPGGARGPRLNPRRRRPPGTSGGEQECFQTGTD